MKNSILDRLNRLTDAKLDFNLVYPTNQDAVLTICKEYCTIDTNEYWKSQLTLKDVETQTQNSSIESNA